MPSTARAAMNKISVLILAVFLSGCCVSKKEALKYGREMYDLGYAQATMESSLERLRWSLEKSYLSARMDRMLQDAEERERRSNPYTITIEEAVHDIPLYRPVMRTEELEQKEKQRQK